MREPVIEISGGGVALGGRPILRHLDLSIGSGEFVAVLGANGSGKSTLIRALLGLHPLTAGSVRLFGQTLTSFGDWSRVGFVPQRSGASSGVPSSVGEVVASGRLSRRTPFLPPSRADRAAVRAALEVVGLASREHEAIANLSGGQQQRALIARALAGEPDVLLLDEPTAGVDLPNQEALARCLRTLSERGVTVVLVAHELGPLEPLIDRVVLMSDGRIAYDGPDLARASAFTGGHGHHHDSGHAHSHAPHLGSPLEGDS
ncbi:MAG: ABC transporter ATP-binding protein [Nocardioides sp.]